MIAAAVMIQRAVRFVFCAPSRSEVHLERREQEDGLVLWAILRNGDAWTKWRRWEYDRMPSSRTAAYLKRARWTFEEAWAECEKIERRLGFGLPVEEVLARCVAALSRSPEWTAEIRDADVAFWTDRDGGHGIRFPLDPQNWQPRELREVAVMAKTACAALGVRVNLQPGRPS